MIKSANPLQALPLNCVMAVDSSAFASSLTADESSWGWGCGVVLFQGSDWMSPTTTNALQHCPTDNPQPFINTYTHTLDLSSSLLASSCALTADALRVVDTDLIPWSTVVLTCRLICCSLSWMVFAASSIVVADEIVLERLWICWWGCRCRWVL